MLLLLAELLDQLVNNKLEAGIFSVLYSINKDKNERIIYYRWILLKILIEAWQLLTTIINPRQGWAFREDAG